MEHGAQNETDDNKDITEIMFGGCLTVIVSLFLIVFIIYGLPDLLNIINRVRVNREFTIEYMDSVNKNCVYNGAQNFICDPRFVYWNRDTLLAEDDYKCYLIELKGKVYRSDMIEIPCGNLKSILWQQPVQIWTKN